MGSSVRHACVVVPGGEKRADSEYVAANGGKDADLGEKLFTFEFDDRGRGNMRFRLVSVAKPAGSVSCVCYIGDRVAPEREGALFKNAGRRISSRTQSGVYVMNVWVWGGQVQPEKAFRRQVRRP